MVTFEPAGAQATDRARHGLERYQQNEAVLQRAWAQLLNTHQDEWVAVYGDGKMVFGSNMRAIANEVPETELDTAVVRYIDPTERALLL